MNNIAVMLYISFDTTLREVYREQFFVTAREAINSEKRILTNTAINMENILSRWVKL